MLSDLINDRYYKRMNPDVAIAECYSLIEEMSALGEGTFSSTAAGATKMVGKAGIGTAKGAAGFGGRVLGNMAKGMGDVANKTVLNNSVGQTLRFNYERIKTIFMEMFKKMMKMIDNLVETVFGYHKRLARLSKDIDMAIAKRNISGEGQSDGEIITPKGLNVIGLDVTQAGSRAALIQSYFKTIKDGGSVIDGIKFNDEKSEREAIEILFQRIVGEKRPFDDITPEMMGQAVDKNLDIFRRLNEDVSAKSKNSFTKGTKDIVKGFFGKGQGASVDSKQLQAAKEKIKGGEIVGTLEQTLKIIKNSADVFIDLEGVTFLKREKENLAEIERSIEKILTEKKQMSQTMSDDRAKNAEFKKTEEAGQIADNKAAAAKAQEKQASQQSVWDEKLFDSIVRAGYAEAISNKDEQPQVDRAGKPIENPNKGQVGPSSGDPMTLKALEKDHQLLTIFFTRYSKALTDTINNCGAVFESLLTAGKSALADYYKVTK